MRLDLQPNGAVDDLVVDSVSLEIARVGDVHYELRVDGTARVVISFWTTRKARVLVDAWGDRPSWTHLDVGPFGELVAFRALDCNLHFEQLDRGTYFLRVSRDRVHWGLNLRAHGYIASRVEPSSTDAT